MYLTCKRSRLSSFCVPVCLSVWTHRPMDCPQIKFISRVFLFKFTSRARERQSRDPSRVCCQEYFEIMYIHMYMCINLTNYITEEHRSKGILLSSALNCFSLVNKYRIWTLLFCSIKIWLLYSILIKETYGTIYTVYRVIISNIKGMMRCYVRPIIQNNL